MAALGEQPTGQRVRAWLKKQRDDLINMSRRNRLLHFKHTKTASLEIVRPAPDEVLRRISRSGSSGAWEFFAGDLARERRAHELVVADKDGDSLGKALRLLKRKTDQEFVDKGVWILYLGLGMLDWVESDDDDTTAASPLLLVPVTLVRDSLREPFRLRRTEDDPVLNPALAVKLDTAAFLRDSVARLNAINVDAGRVAASFGFRTVDLSLSRTVDLAELAGLVGGPTPPEPHWLNPAVQAALDDAARILGELLADFRGRRDALRAVFTDGILALDLHALNVRFTEVHRGLRKLRRAYREDKRALGAATVTGRVDRVVRARLAEAVAWQELSARLSSAESRHAHLIGEHYYQRDDADFDRVSSAIEVVHQALRLAGAELDGSAFSRQLARNGSPDPDLPSLAVRLRATTASWATDAESVLGATTQRLHAMPIGRVVEWCTDTASRLDVVADAIDHVGPVSLAVAGNALELAARAQQLRESVDVGADEDSRLFGGRYRGIDTDWASLRSALTWAAEVRAELDGPVLPRVADAVLGSTVSTDDLDRRLTTWLKSADRITVAFTPRRAEEVADELHGDFADIRVLLNALADTVGDIEEWAAHVAARTTLERAGLEPVVSFCVERKISGDQVAPVVSRALLEAWADDVLASDRDRLGALRAVDRDALVAEFRELDREQIASAAARIINACANRRPTSRVGEAGIIERQSGIDRRHMPIRTLLDRAGRVAQQLKPCFMMSPLSVSQYLPPSLRFDTVIFDEASQVKPSDAVNCVYRGHQLIVAGDQKQLPPTSFGQRIGTVDDDTYDEHQLDEFESLLDLCKAGVLGSLPLNWHYRSKHEALITYSNYEFYSGGLLTFPGATDEAPDVGIELFKVDGVYRRGGARDNPVEAAKVVERVLYHRRHHPDRTLGVVTFSGAQEDAIERELERQTRQYPELAGLDTDDRLHGFFVKNLENVQGDERDIIIFSVVYGPDEHGKFTMGMGPLTWKMGWRRLNVAITRAKNRVEIVTSVLPEQFSSAATSLGVLHLRKYLDFARRGVAALALNLDESSGDAESPFEEEVLRSIRGWGYDAVPQVGVAGYRIDIGIRHPARPGAFALGVECDGAMYHSSKVARDRTGCASRYWRVSAGASTGSGGRPGAGTERPRKHAYVTRSRRRSRGVLMAGSRSTRRRGSRCSPRKRRPRRAAVVDRAISAGQGQRCAHIP